MPRRCVRALKLGDSDNLSEIYWKLHNGILDKRFDVTECDDIIAELHEPELVYMYWELVYSKPQAKWVKLNTVFMREKLLDEFMNRKYKRGRYRNG